MGIETTTTMGESPFSNGIVEKNNKVLFDSMMKTMDDTQCGIATAVAWLIYAKDLLQNVSS